MTVAEGWGQKSLKEHIETAQETAAAALELAETASAEVEAMREELAELRRAVGLPKVGGDLP